MSNKISDLFGSASQAFCRVCSAGCCGKLTAVLFTKRDLFALSQKLGRPPETFASIRRHPESDKHMWQMILNTDGYCTFLTSEKRCSIYSFRPLDCRLYPLDVTYENGKFYWIVYAYDRCKLSQSCSFEDSIVKAEKTILPHFSKDELMLYATDDDAAPPAEYKIIREINVRE